ncbi:MAG: hypothetical protein KKF44_09480 [Nanoarchaeota archaeon]|nr:hypothetical protein [Nanoarchaeota archaeon]
MNKDEVLEIVKQKGMVIPRDVMKELGGDTFLIGAVLSQLTDSKQLRVSNTKIGGSPVYYCPGNEYRLQSLYKYLAFVEKKAFDLLKEKRIIEDSGAEPAIRVALRSIKDFAKPVEVNLTDRKLLFWKWYLLANSEVEAKIREIIKDMLPKRPGVPAQEEKPKAEEKTHEEHKTEIPTKEKEPETEKKKVAEKQEELDEKDNHEEIVDSFFQKIKKHLEKKEIKIINTEIVKKNKEIDLILKVPSAVGTLNFYCKAKDKKRNNEGDLSTAYVKGGNEKLPILFITTGDLTKKAEEMLKKEFLNITVNKI